MKTPFSFPLAGLAFLLVTLVSCDNFIDIQPQEELPSAIALNTVTKFEQAIAGCYGPFTGGSLYGDDLHIQGELMADNVDLSVSYTQDVVATYSSTRFDDVNRRIWADGYRAIRNCNELIRALDNNIEIAGATPAQRTIWRGECLAIRAILHFELVRLWGKPYSNSPSADLGVVLRNVPITADQAFDRSPRATVGQIYAAVIADLIAAEGLLPSTSTARGRLTSWAAKAMLARVYFNQNDFTNAYNKSNEVIASNLFEVANKTTSNDIAAFRNTGSNAPAGGVIWQVVFDGNPGISARTRATTQSTPFSTGAGSLDAAITALSNDTRNSTLFRTVTSGRAYTEKWSPTTALNVPVLRVQEIHLIRAEAGAEINQNVTAAASLDSVRRQYFTGATYVPNGLSGTALRDAVRAERRVEMAFELADRYHELRRQRGTLRGVPYNDSRLLLKIPDTEIGSNPDIIQN